MGWPTQCLETVAAVVRGVTFDKSEVSAEFGDGRVPILRAGNISDVLNTRSDLIWVPSARVRPNQRLREGDIAICMSSGSPTVVGKSAPLRVDWSGSVGAFCAIVRPEQSRMDPSFLAFYMRSEIFRAWTRRSEGVNIKNIRHSELLNVRVPVPPITAQRHIVDLLSRAENIVRMRLEAEQKTKDIIRALFLDMFGDPATNPKGWAVVPLGRLLLDGPKNGLYKHASLYGEGTPILRIDSFYDGAVDDISALRRVRISDDEMQAFSLQHGDIVVNRVNSPEYLGKTAIVPILSEPTVFESNMMRLKLNTEIVSPEYVIQQLQLLSMRRALIINAKHAINQSSINQTDVKALEVVVPPVKLQELFVARVRALVALAKRQRDGSSIAGAVFQSLLTEGFARCAGFEEIINTTL